LASAQDYYPFGMLEPGRSWNAGNYRYGFNGQEKSDEIKGEGNSYTAQFWEYDPKIGRRWNLDPEPIAGISQYSAFNNSPIFFSDPLGNYSDPPGWYTKFKAYVQVFSVLAGGDAKETGEAFDREMNNLASTRVKSWSEIKSDTKEAAGNAYWSFWGSTNGVLKQLTFGAYSKSPADFNLNDKQAEYFKTASDFTQNAPLPFEGGGNLSPRVALSGSGGAVLKPATNLEVKVVTTVFANSASGQQQNSSQQQTSASSTPASRFYDRPEVETRSGVAIRQRDVLTRWNQFLGPNQTNIDPRDGLVDPHEGTPNRSGLQHFHEETWYPDRVENVLRRVQN